MLLFLLAILLTSSLVADNQTPMTSPVLPQDSIPFRIRIEEADFAIPAVHSGVYGTYKGKWLILSGRTNGLHGFDNNDNNFPPMQQNRVAYVVDPVAKTFVGRALDDHSGLTTEQIDELSTTSPQFFQARDTLYISGGYGVITKTGEFNTKNTLTAIDLDGFMRWVERETNHKASKYIRQTSHPLLRVTGGDMQPTDPRLAMLLIFGQDFKGFYTPGSNGKYTKQVRRFQIIDTGEKLYVVAKKSEPENPSYRRRDLNVVPYIKDGSNAYVALSGVFTESGGIFTVPVIINPDGSTFMADPEEGFKQGMNNYISATTTLYSKEREENYILLLGGMTFGYFENGVFLTDSEIPFTNEITSVRIDKEGKFEQFLMEGEFPVIPSTGTNPGNTLLFGSGAEFLPADNVPLYLNGVIRYDDLDKPVLIGYIVGGIMSTLPNTNTREDSTASPYVFKVFVEPK